MTNPTMQDLINRIETGTITLAEITAPEVYKIIPSGWYQLARMCLRLTDLMENSIVEVGIRKGLLVVKFKGATELDSNISELFRNAIAKESSVTCMICGNRGFRRKAEAHTPTLCGPHYVEYVNFLDGR